MEFRKAKDLLEGEALPRIKALIEKFKQEGDVEDKSKDLADSRYSFVYRKKYALYLKKFAFYDQSNDILNNIIQDEINFYNISTVPNKAVQKVEIVAASIEEPIQNISI